MTLDEYLKVKQEINRKVSAKELLTDSEASIVLEHVIDTLIEVGNGVSEEDLRDCTNLLFSFRTYYDHLIKKS